MSWFCPLRSSAYSSYWEARFQVYRVDLTPFLSQNLHTITFVFPTFVGIKLLNKPFSNKDFDRGHEQYTSYRLIR